MKFAQSSSALAGRVNAGLFRCEGYEMAAETLLAPAPASEAQIRDWATVFAFRATKGERVVLELFGLQDAATPQVRVLAYVSNVRADEERPPQKTLHKFPNLESATTFADEAILCFEYLGCIITSEFA